MPVIPCTFVTDPPTNQEAGDSFGPPETWPCVLVGSTAKFAWAGHVIHATALHDKSIVVWGQHIEPTHLQAPDVVRIVPPFVPGAVIPPDPPSGAGWHCSFSK
ncbi:hypothetical protein RAS1_11260 [Phycisphaerae bacterium RAS1]|nr:hypothetical protein RAS1_11260 [Phycisphaerae bacterium RAS1]